VFNEEYHWASRHTADSWRERYKKRQQYFDPLIEDYVRRNPPKADGKGTLPYSRAIPVAEYEERQEEPLSFDERDNDDQLHMENPPDGKILIVPRYLTCEHYSSCASTSNCAKS